MVPSLRDGDIVTIEAARPYGLGQVVLSGAGAGLILHRVVFRRNGRVVTKGDALGGLDAPVAAGAILGVAVARERGGRVVRLDTFWARFRGLAFSLSIPFIPGLWRFCSSLMNLSNSKYLITINSIFPYF
jgi:hypothetical protein